MLIQLIWSPVEYQVYASVQPCSASPPYPLARFAHTDTADGESGQADIRRPADTVLTRMYNQNTVKDPVTGRVRGALYTNPIDCLWKTFKAEGIAGWYKGECASALNSLESFG